MTDQSSSAGPHTDQQREAVDAAVAESSFPGDEIDRPLRVSDELVIKIFREDDPAWDLMDNELSRFSIYHSNRWKTLIQKVFGHRPTCIAAIRGETLVDALPLYRIHFPLLGTKLLSTPYEGCHGGLVSDDVEARSAIIRRSIQLGRSLGAQTIEIRHEKPLAECAAQGYAQQSPFLISTLSLKNEEENWQMLSAKHRRNVRYSRKRGVTTRPGSSLSDMRFFYDLVSRHYKGLGVPFPGRVYFDEIWNTLVLTQRATLDLALADDRVIGGHLMFHSGKTLISKYSAYRKDSVYKRSYASYLLYWEAIKFGIEKGFRFFNMGITSEDNEGLLRFKENFGCESTKIYFYNYAISGNIPDYEKLYDGHKFVKKVWSLLPNFVIKYPGHIINKWIC